MLARAVASSALLRLEEIAVAAGASTTTTNAARRTTASHDGRDQLGVRIIDLPTGSPTCHTAGSGCDPRAGGLAHTSRRAASR